MKKLVCALALLSVLAMPQHLIAAAAQETLESTISDLLQVLKNKTEEGTPEYQQQREELVRIIDKIFAFDELSARAVGLHWKRFSPEQQDTFIQLFSELLGDKYLDRIQSYNNERVIYGDVRKSSSGNEEVQTLIVQENKEIPIAYRMTQTNQGWKVYDVVIEGVSLVKNYRTQFMDIMVNGKPEDLIEAVRKKVTATKSGSSFWKLPDEPRGSKCICMLMYAIN